MGSISQRYIVGAPCLDKQVYDIATVLCSSESPANYNYMYMA
jgi:hypothetical protein